MQPLFPALHAPIVHAYVVFALHVYVVSGTQFAASFEEPVPLHGPRPLHWFCVGSLMHRPLLHCVSAVQMHVVGAAVLHAPRLPAHAYEVPAVHDGGVDSCTQFAASFEALALPPHGPRPLHWFCVGSLTQRLLAHIEFDVQRHAEWAVLQVPSVHEYVAVPAQVAVLVGWTQLSESLVALALPVHGPWPVHWLCVGSLTHRPLVHWLLLVQRHAVSAVLSAPVAHEYASPATHEGGDVATTQLAASFEALALPLHGPRLLHWFCVGSFTHRSLAHMLSDVQRQDVLFAVLQVPSVHPYVVFEVHVSVACWTQLAASFVALALPVQGPRPVHWLSVASLTQWPLAHCVSAVQMHLLGVTSHVPSVHVCVVVSVHAEGSVVAMGWQPKLSAVPVPVHVPPAAVHAAEGTQCWLGHCESLVHTQGAPIASVLHVPFVHVYEVPGVQALGEHEPGVAPLHEYVVSLQSAFVEQGSEQVPVPPVAP
jgi:hypothetical protein